MQSDPLEILYEDDEFLIVHKPSNILSMGQSPDEPSTLRALYNYLTGRPGESRPFIAMIGRLDYPVSGLLLVVKEQQLASQIWRQLEQRRVRKTYLAIVSGDLMRTHGKLEHHIIRDRRRRHVKIGSSADPDAQHAILRFRLVRSFDQHALVAIKLETGRKHQIRAQFAQIGHPILGDRKYGSKIVTDCGIALRCESIRFVHPETNHVFRFRLDDHDAWCQQFLES